MRLFVSVIATAAMFFVASTASAVEFSVVGADNASVLVGDQVTIDIVLTNADATALNGLGASVSNYSANADFVGGTAVANYFNQICIAPGTCFGGLENLAGGALAESAIGANGDRVQIALSAGLSAVSNTGVGVDQGLDGNVGSPMFTLTFVATAAGTSIIEIGTGYQGDGVILGDGSSIQAQGATFTLNVIPEPGTALLMGLGLAGLAAAGRRE